MTLFSQFSKNQKKDQDRIEKENMILLESKISEVVEVFERRAVNYYELMDILNILQGRTNVKLAEILKENSRQIKVLFDENDRLQKENEKLILQINDSEQSTENTAEEAAQ